MVRTSDTPAASDHVVQLFDMIDSMAAGVASFLAQGLTRQAALLVVARKEHSDAIIQSLQSSGCDTNALIAAGTLTVVEAKHALRQFLRGGRPDAALFEAAVADLVRRLIAGSDGPLYVYGEMVDILAEEGNYAAAEELEGLWNQLGQSESFSLLCGYTSSNFAAPVKGAERLRAVCHLHSRVHQSSEDMLGNWLLDTIPSASAAN
jgi:hypothetical protein